MTDTEFLEENNATLKHIKTIPALESFSTNDLEQLLTVSSIDTFKDGELIIAEDDNSDERVFYLISGKVKVMKHGRELMVLRRTGDVFGEIGVITGIARSASVYASGKTTCLAVRFSHIDHLDENCRLTFKYMIYRSFTEILANRLKKTTEELIEARQKIDHLENS